MATVEVSIVPVGTKTTSIGDFVADVIRHLNNRRCRYQLTPMGTILDGEITELFGILQEIHEIPFRNGAMRVVTKIVIDDRRDKRVSMDDKVISVAMRLGEKRE